MLGVVVGVFVALVIILAIWMVRKGPPPPPWPPSPPD